MSQNCKLLPNLDQNSTKTLNLRVLQRIDPSVEEILMTAAHVTFYEFSMNSNQWSRKDVEGSLFVVKRNSQPRFQFIVMNRRSTENLVENLLGDFEYEIQPPYLLYRNGPQEVSGIWFYNQRECEAVANLFSRILNAYSKVPPKVKVSSTISSEFEELEAVPSLDVIEGPLEPPRSSTSTSAVPEIPDSTFVNFFSSVMNIGNTPNVAIEGQQHSSATAISLPFYHTHNTIPSTIPFLQPTIFNPASSNPLMYILNAQEPNDNTNPVTNLINPSFFSPSSSSSSSSLMIPSLSPSVPTAPPLHPSVTLQRPYGAPLLQPFPPPTPSLYLNPMQNEPIITKEKVRVAFTRLVQNNEFIDMVYREILNAHNSKQT